MSLEARANASRKAGSRPGLGGTYSTSLVKGDTRNAQDFANNQALIRGMAKAQRQGDWITYSQLQAQLKHAA